MTYNSSSPVDVEPQPKKRWSDLSPAARAAIVLGAIAELIATTIALRDLLRRPTEQVRGGRLPWLLGFVVQPFGPLLYLAFGRRTATR